MDVAIHDIENTYARLADARRAFFVPGRDPLSVFAGLVMFQSEDVLVHCSDGGDVDVLSACACQDVVAVDEPTAAAFLAASENQPRKGCLFWLLSSLCGACVRVPDLRAIADAAQRARAMLVVDNSLATSFGCNPLFLGAHLCLECIDISESDEPLVAVGIARPERKRRVFDELAAEAFDLLDACTSGSLSPERLNGLSVAFEVLPGIAQKRFDHARAIAEYAAANEMIAETHYPGLKAHADHDVAARVLTHGAGPTLEIELPESIDAPSFLSRMDAHYVSGEPLCSTTRTRIYTLDPPDRQRLRIVAGADDPLAVVDTIDHALRSFSQPRALAG